jgi:uncharacterized protein (UPF0332 family)
VEDRLIFELSEYRMNRARETLADAKSLLEGNRVESSINRSYYAIFHALRAVTALDGFDSSKHSGIIAHFNQVYVKEGVFDKELSKLIRVAFNTREKADYDDFAEVTYEMAAEQIAAAEKIIAAVERYLGENRK